MYYPMYFDPTYVLVLIGVVICMIASAKMNSTFNKYSKVLNMKGLTGAAAAQRVLEHGGSLLTQVQMTGGHLTDHFDPKTNIIRLSQGVYGSATVSAVGWQPMKQVTRFSMQQVMDLSIQDCYLSDCKYWF